MASYSKQKLSGSTDGKMITVAATVSASATTVHQAQSGTSNFDELWIYATNINVSSVNLTLEWGAAGSTNEIKLSIPSQSGLTLIVPGLVLQNSATVTAYASVASNILLSGYVNRIS